MARKSRLHLPGGFYHVMLRGNGGQPIFSGKEDRAYFSALIGEGVERFGHRIHAYCWMGNHVHLAIQVGDVPLSKIIQNVSFRYTRWNNKRKGRYGHLFQGRYKAILVDADSYLLELVRYIHLNPVRAGLVEKPHLYTWSGHCGYLDDNAPQWLTTEWVLSQFDRRLERARSAYENFVLEGMGEGRREDFHSGNKEGRLLGDDDFIQRVLLQNAERSPLSVDLEMIVGRVCEHFCITPSELSSRGRSRHVSEARAWVALLSVETRAATLTDLAHRFNRDVATLSNGIRRLRERINKEEELAIRLGKLREMLGIESVVT